MLWTTFKSWFSSSLALACLGYHEQCSYDRTGCKRLCSKHGEGAQPGTRALQSSAFTDHHRIPRVGKDPPGPSQPSCLDKSLSKPALPWGERARRSVQKALTRATRGSRPGAEGREGTHRAVLSMLAPSSGPAEAFSTAEHAGFLRGRETFPLSPPTPEARRAPPLHQPGWAPARTHRAVPPPHAAIPGPP